MGKKYMLHAREAALLATCLRSRCGSVIVKDDRVIGTGYNSPPGDDERERRCLNDKERYHRKVTDKTCCVHAEERAIMDALRKYPDKVAGSRLYFVRLDAVGAIQYSGRPYCTICSKLALDCGVVEFLLWHEEGITAYETGEYNRLSFEFASE